MSGYSQQLGYHQTKKLVCWTCLLMKTSLIYGLDKLGHACFVASTVCCFHSLLVYSRRGFEAVFMDGHSSVDVTQSEGDLPDFNQSEH